MTLKRHKQCCPALRFYDIITAKQKSQIILYQKEHTLRLKQITKIKNRYPPKPLSSNYLTLNGGTPNTGCDFVGSRVVETVVERPMVDA